MIKKTLTRMIAVSLSAVMVLQLTACGTIFYPERKGTKSGEIDPIVAVVSAGVDASPVFVPDVFPTTIC